MCQIGTALDHDVRTALNAIMGFAQILNLKNNSKEEVRSYSCIIFQQSQTLLDIFTEMQHNFKSGKEDAGLSVIQPNSQ